MTDITEKFPNGQIFNGFTFGDELLVRGTGINLTVGAIMKVSDNVRLGANISSPTSMKVNETYTSYIAFDQKPNTFVSDDQELSTVPNDFKYRISSPLKANLGASVFLPKKLGVVSVEAEYVGYNMMNVKDKEDNRWSSDQKRGIQSEFKDVINLKAGGELRFGVARVRAGLNYLGDPRKNSDAFNTSSTVIGTLGGGIRNNRFFADISYSRTSRNFAFTPYTLVNETDYESATLKQTKGTLGISFGTFF